MSGNLSLIRSSFSRASSSATLARSSSTRLRKEKR
jgi:hypothetical protein